MADPTQRDGFTLKRWSQRKLAASRGAQAPATPEPPPTTAAASQPATAAASAAPELPAIDSLTLDSDFAQFLRPDVDETVRRSALRKLFSDPRFNVMDGLDVYIDDYSQPDPLPAAIARTLVQGRYVFDPPPTRVNADGHVEDVPREAAPAVADGEQRASPDAPSVTVPEEPRIADESRLENDSDTERDPK